MASPPVVLTFVFVLTALAAAEGSRKLSEAQVESYYGGTPTPSGDTIATSLLLASTSVQATIVTTASLLVAKPPSSPPAVYSSPAPVYKPPSSPPPVYSSPAPVSRRRRHRQCTRLQLRFTVLVASSHSSPAPVYKPPAPVYKLPSSPPPVYSSPVASLLVSCSRLSATGVLLAASCGISCIRDIVAGKPDHRNALGLRSTYYKTSPCRFF